MDDSRRKKKRGGKRRVGAATRARVVSSKQNPPDALVDTTDIPPLSEEFFREAVRNPFYRRLK